MFASSGASVAPLGSMRPSAPRAARSHSCSVHGRADDGTLVLKGSRVLRAGRAATLHVPLTRAGRRLVRRGRALRVLLTVSAPGSGTAAGTVVIRP